MHVLLDMCRHAQTPRLRAASAALACLQCCAALCRRDVPRAKKEDSPVAALDSPRMSQGATQRDKAGGDHKLVRTDRQASIVAL